MQANSRSIDHCSSSRDAQNYQSKRGNFSGYSVIFLIAKIADFIWIKFLKKYALGGFFLYGRWGALHIKR